MPILRPRPFLDKIVFVTGAGNSKKRPSPPWAGFLPDNEPPLSPTERSGFAGKRILITGAGGFLGSAIARRVAHTDAAELILLDQAEYGLYRLDQHLRARNPQLLYSLIVGSINDRALLHQLFTGKPPDIVFHAAALKHVPLMENNPFAATETNILGTLALVEAAQQANTANFVLLSTDKAVAPISIMGATKRIAEQIVLAARAQQSTGSNCKAVRLCNVLGSTGSVAPLFARQMQAGHSLTVTHAEATRLFLSTRDAVHLLLRASSTPTQTGLLIPAKPTLQRIEELAAFTLANRSTSASPAPITYTGLRPADKLHEQLLNASEHSMPATSANLLEVSSPFDAAQLARSLPEIASSVAARDQTRLLDAIQQLVPDFATPLRASEPA